MKTIVVDKNLGISEALAQCEEGDVVLIPAGTYPVNISSEAPRAPEPDDTEG